MSALAFDCTELGLTNGSVEAVHALNLASGPGVIGVLGPNGAGKSTLLRAIATVQRPSSGSLHVGRHDVATIEGRRGARRCLGYAPQHPRFPPRLKLIDAVDIIAVMKELGPDRRRRLAQVWQAIDMVGLRDVATERMGQLSGGMRQRAAIAQAAVGDPDLLVLDEPMASLDPEQRRRFGVELRRSAERRTVVLATHEVQDVTGVCDRVIVLADGRVRFDGHPLGLAAAAAGKVWELDPGTNVADTARPTANGRWRVLGARPSGGVAVDPEPVDGYRYLVEGPDT